MRRFGAMVGLVGLLAIVLVGCSRATPIPAGAQQVHVVVTESEVRLEPTTVHAGDVYLVLDAPPDGSFAFVEMQRTDEATPGPLTDDDIARLARGDTEGTAIGGLDAGGCSAAQNAEDRGQMGPCGNVMKVVLVEGKYAIVGSTPETRDLTTGRWPPMAILEVVP
jgi:hypothetical protein